MTGLAGKRVLVSRPRSQAETMVRRLRDLGAVPVIFPVIETAPVEDGSRLDRAIADLGAYHWIIFTSANGVSAFWERLEGLGLDARALAGLRVAAIGPATARALQERGIQPGFVPAEHVAEAILPGLGDVRGQRILLPRAEIARQALTSALEAQGALPDEIAAYRTLPARPDPESLAELEQGIDVATFTSSSTVLSFINMLGDRARTLLAGALVACIGPITAETAREHGLNVGLIAETYTAEGLVAALEKHFQPEKNEE